MKTRLTGYLILFVGLLVFAPTPRAHYRQVSATVNPIDFMINNTSSGWCTNQGGWPRCVYFHKDIEPGTRRNRFYYIKDEPARYERFTWDDNYITLDRDTTWFNTERNADSYDAKPYGSLLWAKTRNWATGKENSIRYQTRIVGFNISNCSYTPGVEYDDNTPNSIKHFEYHPRKVWGGDVGTVDSIRVFYPAGNEAHWYARNMGWVAWENPIGQERFRWTFRATTTVTPNACKKESTPWPQDDLLGDWPAVFLNQDSLRYPYPTDWDPCHSKANSRGGERIVGISQIPTGNTRTALSRIGDRWRFTGSQTGLLSIDGNTDSRRMRRTVGSNPDWDPGYWKLECNNNEYVAGVSQNHPSCQGNNNFHGILCGTGSSLTNTCRVLRLGSSDNRSTTTSGDWDVGAYKVECGLREYLAGVSVNPSTRRPHALLCCQY